MFWCPDKKSNTHALVFFSHRNAGFFGLNLQRSNLVFSKEYPNEDSRMKTDSPLSTSLLSIDMLPQTVLRMDKNKLNKGFQLRQMRSTKTYVIH